MAILTVKNKQFSGGTALPGGHVTPVPASAVAHESAATLALPDPAHPGQYLTYIFMFWNITGASNSGITSAAEIDIQVASNDVAATAWYVQAGGDGPPWTGVYTYTFSESQDQFLADIPISSVTPAAAWTAGNQKVETKSAVAPAGVDIQAESTIDGEHFDKWITYFGGTAVGTSLHAPANSAIWAAIAYYKLPTGQPPWGPGILHAYEEWQAIRNKLELVADPGPDDLWRMRQLLDKARTQEQVIGEDALSEVITGLDKMSDIQIRGNLAAVRAQQVRLSAAKNLLEGQLSRMKAKQTVKTNKK